MKHFLYTLLALISVSQASDANGEQDPIVGQSFSAATPDPDEGRVTPIVSNRPLDIQLSGISSTSSRYEDMRPSPDERRIGKSGPGAGVVLELEARNSRDNTNQQWSEAELNRVQDTLNRCGIYLADPAQRISFFWKKLPFELITDPHEAVITLDNGVRLYLSKKLVDELVAGLNQNVSGSVTKVQSVKLGYNGQTYQVNLPISVQSGLFGKFPHITIDPITFSCDNKTAKAQCLAGGNDIQLPFRFTNQTGESFYIELSIDDLIRLLGMNESASIVITNKQVQLYAGSGGEKGGAVVITKTVAIKKENGSYVISQPTYDTEDIRY